MKLISLDYNDNFYLKKLPIYFLRTSTGRIGYALSHFYYISRKNKYIKKADEVVYEYSNMPEGIGPSEFWKAADENEPKNGRTYREFIIALPCAFSFKDNKKLLKKFLLELLNESYYYTCVIHKKESQIRGIYNIHAHIMFSEKKIDGIQRKIEVFFKKYCYKNIFKGGAKKDPKWSMKKTLFEIRELWEDILNESLRKKGFSEVSCKSLRNQMREALRKGQFVKANLLNRKPKTIPGYLFKKDVNKMTPNELKKINDYKIQNKRYNREKELYSNFLESKQENEFIINFNDIWNDFNMPKNKIYIDKYSFEEELLLKERFLNHLKYILTDKEIENSILNELSQGRYFYIKNEVKSLSIESDRLEKEKTYAREREIEEVVFKLRKLEEEYESIYALKETVIFKDLYNKILDIKKEENFLISLEINELKQKIYKRRI